MVRATVRIALLAIVATMSLGPSPLRGQDNPLDHPCFSDPYIGQCYPASQCEQCYINYSGSCNCVCGPIPDCPGYYEENDCEVDPFGCRETPQWSTGACMLRCIDVPEATCNDLDFYWFDADADGTEAEPDMECCTHAVSLECRLRSTTEPATCTEPWYDWFDEDNGSDLGCCRLRTEEEIAWYLQHDYDYFDTSACNFTCQSVAAT